MARKRRTPAPAGERPARLADGRFAELAALKGRERAPEPAPVRRRKAPPPSAPARPADAEPDSFARLVGEVTPIDDGNRAPIEAPRPAPVPRPRAAEPAGADDAPARHRPPPGDDAAWFRHQMQDVTPLPDRNLAEDGRIAPDPGPLPERPAGPAPDDVLGHLANGTVPLRDSNRVDLSLPPPVAAPRQHEADERAVLDESLDPFSLEDRLDIGEEAVFLRPGLPRRVLTDLRRGRWIVQGEIDLHGLTRDEARAALAEFLARALVRGMRCLRVVHGKGLRSPGKVGVLKQLSRGWLAQREEILAFCQARPHEGGSGALRVLLRAADKRPRP
jgi:DNA-nicking Smr family endonuclease